MVHLKSIELTNFKGVSRLTCDFDDVTLLAGLNNSGKTTILQGVYLLFAALPRVAEHPHITQGSSSIGTVSLQTALSPLGLRDTTWLASLLGGVESNIAGTFANGLRPELGILRSSATNFTFTLLLPDAIGTPEEIRAALWSVADISAAILTPPGDVPTREAMLNGDEYQNRLRDGQGAQLWRNGIWWAIQSDGFESFSSVQKEISNYFPDVSLLLPTLGVTGTPEILIKYSERGLGPLDIGQSGAGLRTFISLARILEQSPARVLLLDEPDAHLHASQQSVIVDLMLDAAASTQRQVIIASHSPEVIRRVPAECLRWIDRRSETANGGYELSRIMESLGVTAEMYIPRSSLPDVMVYVEGVDDSPIIESLISWCRKHAKAQLPTTLVVPHRDGRFPGPTLQGIVRFTRGLRNGISVVGVRDLDWYYCELPAADALIESGDGWKLVTLPCKELENLFCESWVLFRAYDEAIPEAELRRIVDEESQSQELLDEWCYQVRPRLRDRLPNSMDPSTRERTAETTFTDWKGDANLRRRLVSGKSLLRKVRHRIRQEYRKSFFPTRVFEQLNALTPPLETVARNIFPGFDPTGTSK